MSIKPSEQFHDNLIAQYKELIHEKLKESDHRLEFDHELFEKKLFQVIKAAKLDGLSREEVLKLVEIAKSEIPSHCRAI
jgi:predicted HTH domain antitoxin